MAGTLRVGLAGSPPRAQFSRDRDVPDELWNALGRNIASDIRQIDERHVAVPVERLLAARRWLAETLRTYSCGFDPTQAIVDLLARHDAERIEIGLALTHDPTPVEVDELLSESRFNRQLRDFQERDLGRLLALSHGANFSVPGAGKTTVAYALYEAERQRHGIERLLVIAPLSAFDAWVNEATECFDPVPVVRALKRRPPAGCEVLIVNYQKLGATRYQHIAQWVAEVPCHVILDEAHRMKRGRRGEWGAACLDLAHLAVRRDILTGTPAPQHPRDFVALLDELYPDVVDDFESVGGVPSRLLKTDAGDGRQEGTPWEMFAGSMRAALLSRSRSRWMTLLVRARVA